MNDGIPMPTVLADVTSDKQGVQRDAFRTMGKMVLSALMTAIVLGPVEAFAQTTTNTDPSAPLTGLTTARSKAQSSNLDVTHVQTTGNNLLSILMIVGAYSALRAR